MFAASYDQSDLAERPSFEAPPLPPSILSLFGSVKRNGRFVVPPELHITAVCAELKLDLREALFPEKHVLLVADALCASVEVRLPRGVTIDDRSTSLMASHHVAQDPEEYGPIIHLEGWSVCSDVKFLTD